MNKLAEKIPAENKKAKGSLAVGDWVQKYTMLIILVLVVAFFTWGTEGKLLLPQNVTNLISQNAYVFVLAVGMLLCILTGGNIDLSVGSVVAFVGAVGAIMMQDGINVWAACATMLIIGLGIGIWQGFWIAYVRVPPFIVTLAGMLIFRGLANVVLEGMTVAIKSDAFVSTFGGGANPYIPDIFGGGITMMVSGKETELNTLTLVVGAISIIAYVVSQLNARKIRIKKGYEVESIGLMATKSGLIIAAILFFTIKLSQYKGIPTSLVWVAAIIIIYAYITSKTTIGRHFYAVGGNEKAAKLSGIDTNKIYFMAYANMGLLSALAGMLTIARMTSAQPTYGQNYEMDAIGSCFIGGASAYGGIGTVPGVIIGALLMGVINLGMSIMGVDANYQRVVKGLVLLAAVIFDVVSKKRKA